MRRNTVPRSFRRLRVASLIFLLATGVTAAGPPTAVAMPDAPARGGVSAAYGRLPLSFEANRGQTDPRVKFLARGPRQTIFLTPTETVLALTKREPRAGGRHTPGKLAPPATTGTVLRMTFDGANPTPRMTGLQTLAGDANYFIGNDSTQWRTNVPTYARVRYDDLYPGVDVIYYSADGQLEYDFVVRAGADAARITAGFTGADRLELDDRGDLVLHTAGGPIRQRKPLIYQEVDGARKEIAGGYVLMGQGRVGFWLAAYDATRPLVIDPVVLVYSTYLGGAGTDEGLAIAVDAWGNAYVTGLTDSTNFPTTAGAFQKVDGGSFDAFVTKLNAAGSALVYSTYLGGSGDDESFGIAVDALGNAYVAGFTDSSNFPTTALAFRTTSRGGGDAFVTKLNATGSALVYSTYLGGSDLDAALGIAVDGLGNAYVTGLTSSANFPTTTGAFQKSNGGAFDAFVTKLNAAGAALVQFNYIDGHGSDAGS